MVGKSHVRSHHISHCLGHGVVRCEDVLGRCGLAKLMATADLASNYFFGCPRTCLPVDSDVDAVCRSSSLVRCLTAF